MTRGTFESLCAYSVCVWPEKRKDEERGLYASTLHRLTHKVPLWRVVSGTVCVHESKRGRESCHHKS